MPARFYNGTDYRYGFNGKENERDIINGAQDFGMREYDNRLGRFFTIDPLVKFLHNKTPYCFAGNSPIAFIDMNGGFQIPPSVGEAYPRLKMIARAISNLANKDQSLSNPIIREFIEHAGLPNDAQGLRRALQALTYGSGPIVGVAESSNLGDTPTEPGLFIYIAKDLADDLQNFTYEGNSVKQMSREDYATMLTVLFTMWHEGIHYVSKQTCNDNSPDNGGRDNGDRAEIEGIGFDVGGRRSFMTYWNKGTTDPESTPIPSDIMGSTSLRDSQKFLNDAMKLNYPLYKGGNKKGYNPQAMVAIGENIGRGANKIFKFIIKIFKPAPTRSVPSF